MKERDCAAGATGLTNTSVCLPSQASGRKGLPHRWIVRCQPVTLGRLGELSPPRPPCRHVVSGTTAIRGLGH